MPFVNNDGVHIYYEVTGSGEPLVLQHGLSDSVAAWREYGYLERLKPHYRLIMIDGRGHGYSDKPHDPAAYGLKQRVDDVTAVLDALDTGRTSFCGYSMGGWIGFGMALHAPERVERLVIGGAHPYASSGGFFRRIFADGLLAWVELIEKMAGPLTMTTRERLLSNDIAALSASVADDWADISPALAGAGLPVHLYVGADDPARPLVERCADELPGARCSVLPELNHFQAMGRSDLTAPLILGAFAPQAEQAR